MQRILSYRSLLVATAIALAPFAVNAQATAAITCKDGTTSTATGRGACSGHGGVDKAAAKAAAKAAKQSAKAEKAETKAETKADTRADKAETKAEAKAKQETKRETKAAAKETKAEEKAERKSEPSEARHTTRATAANTDPTNATAKCKDGTYSHAATHRGACSRHGGVAEWLKS